MAYTRVARVLSIFIVAVLTGCSWFSNAPPNIADTYHLDEGNSLAIDAQQRVITNTGVRTGYSTGQVVPNRVICAEPSPDVAAAVAKTIGAELSAAVKTVKADAEVAGKLAGSVATALTDLSERTATIQLLRDTLYRACEAYQNGAISSNGYALILSRFDLLSGTLMLGEFMTGRPGKQSTASPLTGVAAGSISAETIKAAEDDYDKKEKAHEKAQGDLDTALKATPVVAETVEKAKQNEASTRGAAGQAGARLRAAYLGAAIQPLAGSLSANISSGRAASPEIADKIVELQKAYFLRTEADLAPIIATCINTLSNSPPLRSMGRPTELAWNGGTGRTAFAEFCEGQLGNAMTIVGRKLDLTGEIAKLDAEKRRAVADYDAATRRQLVNNLPALIDKCKGATGDQTKYCDAAFQAIGAATRPR